MLGSAIWMLLLRSSKSNDRDAPAAERLLIAAIAGTA
jgi:hypothetical protein